MAFRNGHLTNIMGESEGRLTIRDGKRYIDNVERQFVSVQCRQMIFSILGASIDEFVFIRVYMCRGR